MAIKNNSQTWGSLSIGLHWLTLILILGLAVVGLNMDNMPNGPLKIQVYALHKSTGLTVLALTVIRLAWRFFSVTPDAIPGTPKWQALIAKLV
ncbi:MAG: cytochrome b/b6 domain-containing protein, partial [Arenimonas sp.]